MPHDDRKPSPRNLKRVGMFAVAFIALTIVLIFVGENIAHKKTLDDAKRSNPAAIG